MIVQFIVALILLLLCLTAQGFCYDYILRRFPQIARRCVTLLPRAGRTATMVLVALAALLPHIAAVLLWSLFYVYGAGAGEPDAFFEAGFYFAAATHSTAGFGDITMNESWRVLSTLQALGGLLMFAWTAALLWEILGRLYRAPAKDRN